MCAIGPWHPRPQLRISGTRAISMRTWQQSRARKLRKYLVARYGRERAASLVAGMDHTPPPKYTRPDLTEALIMWRLADRGLNLRAIARRLKRDHHTVARHLQPARGHELALQLAFRGRGREARELVSLLGGSPELALGVEKGLRAGRALMASEHQRIEALAEGLF
jgi:hypothetical protein